jgi:hypothetical protein
MDLDMVFNELSLRIPADSIQIAQQRMSELIATAREAAELGVKPVIRTHSNFYASVLANNYSLSDWLADRNTDREELRFLLATAKTPFLADVHNSEIANQNILSDFYCEDENCEGLGIAHILESLALSIQSEPCWNVNSVVIKIIWLDDDNFNSDIITVFHANCKEHVKKNIAWIQERLRTSVSNGLELWERREELFPSLDFCEVASQQIQNLGTGNPMLRQVIKRLFELETSCKNWTVGAFDLDSLPSKTSPESESRLKRLKKQLTFRCPDNKERIFSLHVRMTGASAWRLYFSTDLGIGKVIIGYIGLKIE